MGKERKGRSRGEGKKMREGRRKVCLLLNGGLVTPLRLDALFVVQPPDKCQHSRALMVTTYISLETPLAEGLT